MEYKSNAKDVILNIKQKLLSNESQQALLQTIAQTIYVSNLRRIHNEGINVNGTRIGSYSIKPFYINPKYAPKKIIPQGKGKNGKPGRKTFKTWHGHKVEDKPHKTKYYDTGYYGFRRAMGRDATHVNLQLSGFLKTNFQMVKVPNGYSIGFLSYRMGQRSEGLEKHFNCNIWGVSNNDRTVINQIVKNWIHRK